MSAVAWWYEDWADLDFDAEPDPPLDSQEALTVASGAVWWSAAASVFDFDD